MDCAAHLLNTRTQQRGAVCVAEINETQVHTVSNFLYFEVKQFGLLLGRDAFIQSAGCKALDPLETPKPQNN
eukprot:1174107-Amphidinium_carterae.1